MKNENRYLTIFLISFVCLSFFFQSCTLSFSNISNMTSNGESKDVVDEEQDPSNDIKPSVSVPSIPGL